jgi:hypothetical protein
MTSINKRSEFPPLAICRLAAISLGVLVLIFALLYFAEFVPDNHPVFRKVIQSLAALLLTSGLVSIMLYHFVRKQLTRFWLDAIGVKESIELAGLRHIELDFYAYDFHSLIRESKQIDIYVIHADKWLGNRLNDFREFLSHKDHELRVCFLDENSPGASALSEDFGYPAGLLASKIENSQNAILSIVSEIGNTGQKPAWVRIWKQNRIPRYTYYRFDETFVFVPYNLGSARSVLPVLVFDKKDGGISEFLSKEFEGVLKEDASLIYDSHSTEVAQ